METATLVLAAGYSRRFGSDKRLACVDGEPMLLRTLQWVYAAMDNLPGGEIQIVLRARDSLVASMVSRLRGNTALHWLYAPVWPVGLGVSIAAGLDALLQRSGTCPPRAVALCLGDMPFVQPQTLRHLLAVARPDTICVPTWSGQRGHPVVFGRAFFPELLALKGRSGAARVLRDRPQAIVEVPVDDPGITQDIDRPEDFHAAVHGDRADTACAALHTAADVPPASPWG